jgi:hypothetical protein
VLARVEPDAVLVTIPDAPREILDRIVAACADADVYCRFVRREHLDPRVILGAAADVYCRFVRREHLDPRVILGAAAE